LGSSSRKNVDQVALINAKVKGVDNALGTPQDPVIAQMARSYGTTGSVQVLELEGDEEKQVELFQKIFSLRQGSTASFAKKFFKQELATPELKRKMAYFTAMAQFVDLCSKASFGVDLCINMETESFLYRKAKKGVVELASEVYDNDEDVVALQPPTYCEYTQARHKPSWAKASSWTNSSFTKCVANATKAVPGSLTNMVFHRERLMSKLPFSVDKDDLDLEKGFDHAFWTGLSPQGVVKGMQCGHSFVIRAATETSGCKGKPVHMKQQALSIAKSKADPKASERAKLDALSGEYGTFNQRVVSGIEMMVDRLENGDFPPVLQELGRLQGGAEDRKTRSWAPGGGPAACSRRAKLRGCEVARSGAAAAGCYLLSDLPRSLLFPVPASSPFCPALSLVLAPTAPSVLPSISSSQWLMMCRRGALNQALA